MLSTKLFLEEVPTEHEVLLFHTFFLLKEIKDCMESRGEDTALLSNAGWLHDLMLLTYNTEKMNHLNLQVQGRNKTICEDQRCKVSIVTSHL